MESLPINFFKDKLRLRFQEELKHILSAVNSLTKSTKNYRLLKLGKDMIVAIHISNETITKPEIIFNIGFPFPIYSFTEDNFTLDAKYGQNVSIKVFLRGEIIHQHQRLQMFKYANVIHQMDDIYDFNEIVKTDFEKADTLFYFDQYTYIGDSIIGLHYLKAFKETFMIKDSYIFSNSAQHLTALENNVYLNISSTINERLTNNCYILMPSSLDNYWEYILLIVAKLDTLDSFYLAIPGKNIYYRKINNKKELFWLKSSDHELSYHNIEDFMNEALYPFTLRKDYATIYYPTRISKISKNFIYINPFSSTDKKFIQPTVMLDIYRKFKKNQSVKVKLIGGIAENYNHQIWVNIFEDMLTEEDKIDFSIEYYKDLSQLADEIYNQCFLVITADTSIAHLANAVGIPSIVLYQPAVWDNCSIQSMACDSPLGFCRYNPLQIPVIVSNNVEAQAKVIAKLSQLFQLLTEPNHDGLAIMSKIQNSLPLIYDYAKLVNKLCNKKADKCKEVENLISTSIKISPQYKLDLLSGLIKDGFL